MARIGNESSAFDGSLLRGMREAVAVARGEAKPTRVYTLSRLKADDHSIVKPPAYRKDRITG